MRDMWLVMRDMWLAMRDMWLAMRDVAKIGVGNERQPKSQLAMRDMNIIKWFKATFKVTTTLRATR